MVHLIFYTLLGGVTGYGTNHYAIEMLFRRVLCFGGVITATRRQLAEELGALVEREIINNRTVQNELAQDEFKAAFRAVVTDFLERHLYKNIPDVAVGDLPGMAPTRDNILALSRAHLPDAVRELVRLLVANGLADDLTSRRQCAHTAARIYDLGLDVVREDRLVRSLVDGLYQEVRGREVSRFVSGRVFKAVAGSLGRRLSDFHVRLERDFDPQIDAAVERIYAALDLDGIGAALADMVCRRTPVELVGRDRADNLADEVLNRCAQFLQSADGRRLVDDLSVEIMTLLKEIEMPLLSLLGPDLQSRVEQFLERELPAVINGLITWIWEHKAEIEDLIEETIDDVLAAEAQTGVTGWLKKWLKHTFLPSITEQYDVIARIVAAIESGDVEHLSRQLSGEIIAYIKGNSVARIMADLEARGLITPELIAALLSRNLGTMWPKVRLQNGILQRPVGEFVGKGALAGLWDEYGRPAFFRYLKRSLYAPRTAEFMQRGVAGLIGGLGTRAVSDLISPAAAIKAAPFLENWVLEECIARRGQFSELIAVRLREYIQNWLVSDAARRSLAARASVLLLARAEREIAAAGDRRIRPLYEMAAGHPGAVDGLTNLALGLTDRHLESLLEGNIRKAVTDNLLGLPDEVLLQKVQGFIGGELRPITTIGGVLGLLGGPVSMASVFSTAPLVLVAGSAGLFGLIGLGTNWLALRMLFRPHRQCRVLNRGLWLTPGVIPKNQARFAREMSGFIEDELLDRETVRHFFAGVRDQAEAELLEKVAARDYEAVKDLIRREQPRMVDFLVAWAIGFGNRKRGVIAGLGVRLTAGIDLSEWDYEPAQKQLGVALKRALPGLGAALENEVRKLIQSDRALGAALPDLIRDRLPTVLGDYIEASVRDVARGLGDDEQFDRWMGALAPAFDRFMGRTPGDLAGDRRGEWREKIVSLLTARLTPSVGGRVVSFVTERLARELHPERKIGAVFDGFLVELMETNADHILEHLRDQAESYLRKEQPALAAMIKKAMREDRGWLENQWLNLLNVDRTIALVVDELVNVRVPGYLDERRKDLRDFVRIAMDESVIAKTLGDIGIGLDENRIQSMAASLMENPATTRVVSRLTGNIVDSLFRIPLKNIFRIVSVSSWADVRRVFTAEIQTARMNLAERLKTESRSVRVAAEPLPGEIMERYLLDCTLRQVLGDIPREQIAWSVRNMLKTVQESETFANMLEAGLRRTAEEVRRRQPHDLVDFGVLEADIARAVDRLAASDRFHRDLRAWLFGLTDLLVRGERPEVLAVLDKAAVDYILRTGARGLMDALEDHLGDIVNAVHIGEVAERELSRLNPEEIERLFDSFAGSYFTKLKLYGLYFGGILGAGAGLVHVLA